MIVEATKEETYARKRSVPEEDGEADVEEVF